MAFTEEELVDIESSMVDFMRKRRPPVEIREKLDLAWRIEGQSVVIYSIRPQFDDTSRKIEEMTAKATYVRTSNRWKVYWQRADMKWHGYPPHPEALFLDEFLAVVDEDDHGCFWG